MSYDNTEVLNPETGRWEPAVPMPYPFPFFQWMWKRLIGWRDAYGRKAEFGGWKL